MKRLPYCQWFTMLQLVMIGAGVFGTDLDFTVIRPYNFKLDENAFRHFYDDGLSPMEAYLIDIEEGGEQS